MHKIVRISVFGMYESCERWTYYVRATTDEGMTKEVEGHVTGSLYTEVDGVRQGLTRDEARDRALIDAATWGDFLGITPEPFKEKDDNGVEQTYEPSMVFHFYRNRRAMKERA